MINPERREFVHFIPQEAAEDEVDLALRALTHSIKEELDAKDSLDLFSDDITQLYLGITRSISLDTMRANRHTAEKKKVQSIINNRLPSYKSKHSVNGFIVDDESAIAVWVPGELAITHLTPRMSITASHLSTVKIMPVSEGLLDGAYITNGSVNKDKEIQDTIMLRLKNPTLIDEDGKTYPFEAGAQVYFPLAYEGFSLRRLGYRALG